MPQAGTWKEDWLSPRVAEFFSGGPTQSGLSVGGEAALRVSTYYACVNVLAQDIAKLPLILYRRLPSGGRERATGHRLYGLLHDRPNRFQTSFRFRQAGQAQIGIRGDCYAFISRYRDEIRELLPIHPDKVTVRMEKDYRLKYKVDGKDYEPRDILHVRGLTLNGWKGTSVATYAREGLGLSLATEAHGARLFGKGALFRGILSHPGRFKNDAVAKRVRESFDNAYSGGNTQGTALLEEGMKYEKVSMTAEDSQFLETREFQAYEIARWFRMPPHKVGLMKQATFSNIEHQALEYVTDTLFPWLVSWEQECGASLLTDEEREAGYYFEHLVDALLRGDMKSRYEAYKTGVLTGFLNRNEVREMENRNPAEGLDEFLEPQNMAAAGNTIDQEPTR